MQEEKTLLNATVCFLAKDGEILLGLKTKKIGKDCWNGYGGGVEEDETVEETAVRELLEETGGVVALPEHLEKIAIVYFHNTKSDGETFTCRVHFFLVRQWRGEAKETEEMIRPTWFDTSNLPFDQMMPADREWLPIALRGQKIIAEARFGPFQKTLLAPVKIKYVDDFPDT